MLCACCPWSKEVATYRLGTHLLQPRARSEICLETCHCRLLPPRPPARSQVPLASWMPILLRQHKFLTEPSLLLQLPPLRVLSISSLIPPPTRRLPPLQARLTSWTPPLLRLSRRPRPAHLTSWTQVRLPLPLPLPLPPVPSLLCRMQLQPPLPPPPPSAVAADR